MAGSSTHRQGASTLKSVTRGPTSRRSARRNSQPARPAPEPAARGRAPARPLVRRVQIAEVREGGAAVARSLPDRRHAAAPALREGRDEPCEPGVLGTAHVDAGSSSARLTQAGRTECKKSKLRPMPIFTGAALLACRGHETKVPRPSYISPPDSSDIGALRTLALPHSCGMGPDFWGARQIDGSRTTRATCG